MAGRLSARGAPGHLPPCCSHYGTQRVLDRKRGARSRVRRTQSQVDLDDLGNRTPRLFELVLSSRWCCALRIAGRGHAGNVPPVRFRTASRCRLPRRRRYRLGTCHRSVGGRRLRGTAQRGADRVHADLAFAGGEPARATGPHSLPPARHAEEPTRTRLRHVFRAHPPRSDGRSPAHHQADRERTHHACPGR